MRVIVSNMANSKATRRYIRVPTGFMRSWINQDQSPPKTILAKSWITFTLDDNLSNTQNQILPEYSILSATTVILKYGADKDLGLCSKNMSFVYITGILIINNHEWPTILAFHNLQSSYTHTHTLIGNIKHPSGYSEGDWYCHSTDEKTEAHCFMSSLNSQNY